MKTDNKCSASVEFLSLFKKILENNGINVSKTFSDAGIDIFLLLQGSKRIPAEVVSLGWQEIEKNNRDENLGLHLANQALEFPGHILFSILLNSPTVGESIANFIRFHNLMNDIVNPELEIGQNTVTVSISYSYPPLASFRHISEAMMAVYFILLKRISDSRITLKKVHFTHPRPYDISEHERVFCSDIFFNQPQNKIVFDKKYLKIPVFLSNQKLLQKLKKHAISVQNEFFPSKSLSDRVTQTILKLLPNKPDMTIVAKKLAMSVRNLQMNLKNEGVTYNQLLSDVRIKLAVEYLKETDLSLFEVACMLGYSNQSAFNRFFKQWTNSTPKEYRSGIHSNPEDQSSNHH